MHGFQKEGDMPADKMMKLFIIQSISAFVANDYNTGIHFLGEIKQTYAEKMGQLNPTLKQVAKEIIQAAFQLAMTTLRNISTREQSTTIDSFYLFLHALIIELLKEIDNLNAQIQSNKE